MNNHALLAQSRRGIALHIAQSPFTVVLSRLPLIDDGFGGLCADPSGIHVPVTIIGRMARESKTVQALQANASGLDSSASMYLIFPYDKTILEGEQFPGYRVGKVTPLMKFGGVQAFEAALYPA